MKKNIFILANVLLLTVSCAKDYNCECTYTNVDDPDDIYTSDSHFRLPKKDAEAGCANLEGTSFSGSLTYEKTCELYPK